MPIYEIASVNEDNSTGYSFGFISASNKKEAVVKMNRRKHLPDHVRVFDTKKVKHKSTSNSMINYQPIKFETNIENIKDLNQSRRFWGI